MEFKYDEVLDLWVTETDLLGQSIKVRLYCSDDADLSVLAGRVMTDVESHWESLRIAIVAGLLPRYSEQSGQEVTADEFFSRLTLKTIDFDAVDVMYTLFWSDSGLFGGHSIQVLWDPEEQFHADVSLVG